ncbi:AAA family ATPase [Salinicola avicenniae]|uniref:AAA family ATPase n=1 Tax=Salinicola avicenniae TaxID=2916836 RepID=UPI002073B966|nr:MULTISPECIES: AAA family ATPase [unclassified Salinicola]
MTQDRATTTISLFGHFACRRDGQVLTQFSYDKVKALLVYLMLQDVPANRAVLAEMLWPDQGVKSGRTNLRHALHCLRQGLGEIADMSLTVTRQTIAFSLPADVSWDLREVESLLERPADRETLDCLLGYYAGDLVAELHLGQCVGFQQWLVRTRGEWRQALIDYAERVLAATPVLPESLLRQLIHRFAGYGPFHERLVRQLAEQGQIAAAREQFNAFLQQLALAGQQPDPGFLQLAGFWSDAPSAADEVAWRASIGLDGPRRGDLSTDDYHVDDIDYRQVAVMAIALVPSKTGNDLGQALACLKAQDRLFQWLETQCRHLGGFWQASVGSGVGLACFGTHGPTHQLAELVALFEHCRQGLPRELARVWEGDGAAPRFSLSAGLDSGRVIWLPERQSIDPFGDVTQVALAMMASAQAGELVISLNASQHLPPTFDLQSRLAARLISSDGRVRQRALVLGGDGGGRTTLPPSLTGREGELRRLRDALARVSLGLRQSLLVLGDTGIGKSALLVHFREQLLQGEEVAIFWRPTTRLSSQTSYGLIQALLRWSLRAALDEASLGALIARTPSLAGIDPERRRLLIDVFGPESLAREDADEAVELVTRLVQALILELTASNRPLVMIVDDLQWLDEPSLKVLHNLQARLPIHTAFLLLASHQNLQWPPVRLAWDQQVVLGRLAPSQSSEMLDYLARRHRLVLRPRLREQLIERCEGVPLYLQEICRRLEIDRREGRRLDVDSLPSGLLGLLASRIDQLQGDRRVAHMAAVLGRQFETSMLADCLDGDESTLKAALSQMRRLEIIEPCEAPPHDLQFTHPLLQEAAYLSCPIDVRTLLHRRVIALIEHRHPAWISRHPGEFAEHLQRSGDAARAARYFEMAARNALKVSANLTARRMAESGLACLGSGSAAAERRISLLTVKGQACYALEGHGSPMAHESFLEAQSLWQSSHLEEDADDQAFLVTWGLWVGASQRHANQVAEGLVGQLRELAERIGDPRYQRLALYARAKGEYWSGKVVRAYEHLEQIDPLNLPMALEWLPYSEHPQVAAACYQAWVLCLRGNYHPAEQQMEAVIRLAERTRHPGSLAMALVFAASLYRQLGHVHLAVEHGRRAHELTRTPDLRRWHLEASCVLGWGQALAGEREGMRCLDASVAQLSELTGKHAVQRPFLWYGDACLALNDAERAVAYLEPCLTEARQHRSLMMPQLCLQLARARHRLGEALHEVAGLIEEAIVWSRDMGSPHVELKGLEAWLQLVASDSVEKQHALRYRLGEVALSDAPILTRWRTLLDNVSTRSSALDFQV